MRSSYVIRLIAIPTKNKYGKVKTGPPRGGQEGQFAPGPQGTHHDGFLTFQLQEGALKCILSQSKGCDRKNILFAVFAGGLALQFCP